MINGGRVRPVNDFIEFAGEQVNQSIPDRFDRQARMYPSRLAVKTSRRSLTYEELNGKANHIAQAILASRGAESEPVSLLLGKDALLIAALLGALKAGKFYIPLDASYPLSRNEHILNDSGASLLLTDGINLPLAEKLSGSKIKLLNIDRLDFRSDAESPDLPISPDRIAYLLYTSGSTGRPKGVVQTHRNVLHNVMKSTNGLHLCAQDRMTLLPSPSVGASVSDYFGALLNGAALFPFDVAEQGFTRLAAWLDEEAITVYHSVPSVFRNLARALNSGNKLPHLRLIKLAGEPVRRKDVDLYQKYFSDACLLHVSLGATEMNIIRQLFINKRTELGGGVMPVGYAVDDTEILLLDETGQEVGPGCVGEIAIKSRYLPTGYWREPELSAAAFLADARGGDEKIYLTGDLGYLLPDGCLVCLGRKDSRVKIRGHRVEAAEVETALLNLKEVKEVAVTAWEDQNGEKRLVAHIVLENGSKPLHTEWRSSLRESLPDYLIPSAFVILDELPRAPGGKLDRSRLENVSPARGVDLRNLRAPRNSIEEQLIKIWEQVLGFKPIGVTDNFFDLGGDSLAAAQLFAEIETDYGKALRPSTLLEAPTVEQMARFLIEEETEHSSLVPIKSTGSGPPFFCVHGIGGEVISFRKLAVYLGEEQPVYGLRAQQQGATDSFSVESLAAHYISEIQRLQPDGPYFLGGYSFGGTVAFEMARRLVEQGKTVGLLALLDTYGPGYPKLLPLKKRWLIYCKKFLQAETPEKVRYLRKSVEINVIRVKKSIRKALDNFGLAAKGIPPEVSLNNLAAAHRQASRTYLPKPYTGKLDLFRTSGQMEIWHPDSLLGWGGLVAGGIQVHYVSGEHATLLAEPHVRTLAEKLGNCLRQAKQEHGLNNSAMTSIPGPYQMSLGTERASQER